MWTPNALNPKTFESNTFSTTNVLKPSQIQQSFVTGNKVTASRYLIIIIFSQITFQKHYNKPNRTRWTTHIALGRNVYRMSYTTWIYFDIRDIVNDDTESTLTHERNILVNFLLNKIGGEKKKITTQTSRVPLWVEDHRDGQTRRCRYRSMDVRLNRGGVARYILYATMWTVNEMT